MVLLHVLRSNLCLPSIPLPSSLLLFGFLVHLCPFGFLRLLFLPLDHPASSPWFTMTTLSRLVSYCSQDDGGHWPEYATARVSLEGTVPCLCWLSPPLSDAVSEQMSIFSWSNYSKPTISSLVLGTWFYHSFHWEDQFTRQEEYMVFFLQWKNGCFSYMVLFLSSLLGPKLFQCLRGPGMKHSSSYMHF